MPKLYMSYRKSGQPKRRVVIISDEQILIKSLFRVLAEVERPSDKRDQCLVVIG